MMASRRQVTLGLSLWAISARAAAQGMPQPLLYVEHDVPPNAGKRADGTIWGRRVGAVRLVAQLAGLELKVALIPWVRAQEAVREGTADMFCASVNAEREDYALFTKAAVLENKHYFYYRKKGPVAGIADQIKSLRDLAPFRIARNLGSQFPNIGRAPLPSDISVPYNRQAMVAIAANQADIYIGEAGPTDYVIDDLKLADQFDRRELNDGSATGQRIGVSKRRPDAAQIIEKFDRAIQLAKADGRLAQAIEQEKL